MFVLAEKKMLQANNMNAVGAESGKVLLAQRRSFTQKLYAGYVKRVLDIVLCVLLIPVLLPVMAVLWLLVRRDGGPGLFIQPRVGRDGRIFQCFKFRTMVVNAEKVLDEMCAKDPAVAAEWLKYQKLSNDPRISRVGRVLRATSLDELPQILNVLLGDMSLVGPRPFLPSQKALYDEAGGATYYHVRPGITGAWQVFGRSATTFKSRVEFDDTYYRNLSLSSDFGLLLRTVTVVFNRTGK
ncbi:sugar transferase [Paenirhodobacter populi]|uniref:Sugar transferase n=1 Tax=Paenirhodobacter populi TaxID=2306993 RepID=A0A443IPY4_9RHOB|nr:sugar transferase [Sinirhodobacter populi]RWR08152.1 sugar transferase [Sinirhodobacter populi]